MKRYKDFIWTLLTMIGYTLCGVIWLYKGLFSEMYIGWFSVVAGLVWLSGAAIFAVRAVRKYQEIKTSNENRVINGGENHE